jgi:D-glycerate 3-kinase
MVEFCWPAEQFFLRPEVLRELESRCKTSFVLTCQMMDIEEDLSPLLPSLYLPLGAWLEKRRQQRHPLTIGICGPQGSGKSTLTALLKTVLTIGWEQRATSFSLDDLYKTSPEREAMARAVHPLFSTRGVPGTHDVDLAIETIERLKAQRAGQSTVIPVFDKGIDDRKPMTTWPRAAGEVDMILFEGWCVGALPEADAALATPINDLERQEDPDGAWRAEVNRALRQEYQRLFKLIDVLIMMKVDSMETVYEWRRLQERKLARKARESDVLTGQWRIMSDHELNRFVMHFERLTRHILADMPCRADVVFFLESSHTPATVLINRPIPPANRL